MSEQVRLRGAHPAIGQNDHPARTASLWDGGKVRENTLDIGAQGIAQFIRVKAAGLHLIDDRGEHKETQQSLPVGLGKGSPQHRQHIVHRAADIQIDMSNRVLHQAIADFEGLRMKDHRPRSIQGPPCGHPPVSRLWDDRFHGSWS